MKTQEKPMKTDSLSYALLPTSWLTAVRGDEQSPRETVADFLWCSVLCIPVSCPGLFVMEGGV